MYALSKELKYYLFLRHNAPLTGFEQNFWQVTNITNEKEYLYF
jgi:hypothetical protein